MNRLSKPSSSTCRANALMPRARSGRRPPRCTRAGRPRTGRHRSWACVPLRAWSASSAAVLGFALGEEGGGALEHVVAWRRPGPTPRARPRGRRRDRGVERRVDEALRLAHGERAAPRRSPRRWPSARATASPAGTTSFTRPIRSASSAVRTRPVRISSFARARPTIRGSRCVPPAPGMTARRTSGRPSRARSDATRMSQQSASSRPPPSALPSIAAIVGMGSAASRRDTRASSASRSRPPRPALRLELADVRAGARRPARRAR